MAVDKYVATTNVNHGGYRKGAPASAPAETVWYERGDELDLDLFTDEDLAQLLRAGSVLPKRVWDAMQAAEVAREEARQAQLDAEAQVARLQHTAGVGAVRTAELVEADHEPVTEDEAKAVASEVREGTKSAVAAGPKTAAVSPQKKA